MAAVTVTERGWPGHFICAHDCIFRRNTLVQADDVRIVVSTVGDMRRPGKPRETIGSDRDYETMCFDATQEYGHWCADVQRNVSVPGEWMLETGSDHAEADAMHDENVRLIAEALSAGERFAGEVE